MIDRYLQMDIMTASPTTLVVKLYEGALRNAFQARIHLEAGQIPDRIRAIERALSIVSELQAALDFEQGGEIAIHLQDLYNFVTSRFIDANLNASPQAIDDAVRVLETLLEGWQQIARNPTAATTVEAAL